MKFAVPLLALALAACSSSTGPGDSPDPDAGASDPDASDVVANADEDRFHDILEGRVAADVGLIEIAQSGGFPIHTRAGAYLFAALDDGSALSLAGDHDNWQGAAMPAEAGVRWIAIDIATPDGSLYKFVTAGGEYVADPLARRYGYDEFGEHSLVRSSAAHRERWPQVQSSGAALATRTVRAWVPAGGTSAIDRHIYVHDGQNLFEPGAPFGGWRLDETALPNALVIGIDNTPDRMDEYTPTTDSLGGGPIGGRGDDYAEFIKSDVIPMIERSYGEPSVRGVMGSSLGGLISLHQALRDPSLFRFVASLSGTVGWGSLGANGETVIHRFDVAAVLPAILYLDSGGTDGGGCVDTDADGINDDSADSDNYCVNRQLADLLAARGYTFDDNLHHFWEPGAGHNEAAWAARMPRVMALFAQVTP